MYAASDPRAAISAAEVDKEVATEFAGAEYIKFYATNPAEDDENGRTWYARGQNFVLVYSEAKAGASFGRENQIDEYALLVPDTSTALEIVAGDEVKKVGGNTIGFIPPGNSTITVKKPGRIIRLFSSRSAGLAEKSGNAESYARPHPNIPAFEAWPAPKGGFRIRIYSLAVESKPGRFGRIFRCSTFMINYLEPRVGPRDTTKLSPHFHDDFEQGSLVLEGDFIHDIRWPWTPNMSVWRKDDHEQCAAPSLTVIPPPAVHTSRAIDSGTNLLVDIFCPPRVDFSSRLGWVLNEDEYPMPQSASE